MQEKRKYRNRKKTILKPFNKKIEKKAIKKTHSHKSIFG